MNAIDIEFVYKYIKERDALIRDEERDLTYLYNFFFGFAFSTLGQFFSFYSILSKICMFYIDNHAKFGLTIVLFKDARRRLDQVCQQ